MSDHDENAGLERESEKKPDKWNHRADALRYLTTGLFANRRDEAAAESELTPQESATWRRYASDALGYYTYNRYDPEEIERCKTFEAQLGLRDLVRGFLCKHRRAITWGLNAASFVMSVLALVLSLLALTSCARETPIADTSGSAASTAAPKQEISREQQPPYESESVQPNVHPISPEEWAASGSSLETVTSTVQPGYRLADGHVVNLAALANAVALSCNVEPCPSTCNPPATFTAICAKPPYDAPVRIGEVVRMGGGIMWQWKKAGEPSRPCTAQQIANDKSDAYACARKVGDVLYVTPVFRSKRATREGLATSEANEVVAQISSVPSVTAIRPGGVVDEVFRAPRYAFVRIPQPGAAVKFHVLRYLSLNERRFYARNYRSADSSVTLPILIEGPAELQSVELIAEFADGSTRTILPDTLLRDLPRYVP